MLRPRLSGEIEPTVAMIRLSWKAFYFCELRHFFRKKRHRYIMFLPGMKHLEY